MKHRLISFIKSGVRIVGFGLIIDSLLLGIIILIVAELIGVVEEL